ncbi:MAG: hypothetical protein AB7T63_16030 [Planctomycetota bacterium]
MRRARPERVTRYLAWRQHVPRQASRGLRRTLARTTASAHAQAWTWHARSAPADEARMPDEAVVALLHALRTRRAPPTRVTDRRAPCVLLLVAASALAGSLVSTSAGGPAASHRAGAAGLEALAAPVAPPSGAPHHGPPLPTPFTEAPRREPGAAAGHGSSRDVVASDR